MCCVAPTCHVKAGKLPSLTLGACRDRLCPFCQASRAKRLRVRLTAIMAKMNTARLITLTTRDDTRPLGVRIDELYAAFRRLRGSKAWKRHVIGGVFVLEITRNTEKGTWHPHLHCIVDGTYFDKKVLASAWNVASRGAKIVDVRMVYDKASQARYLASYLSASLKADDWTEQEVCGYAVGIHGRRMVGTFGTAHTVRVDEQPKPEQAPRDADRRVSVTELRGWIDAGSEEAQRAARALSKLGGAWRLIFLDFAERGVEIDGPFTPSDLDELNHVMNALCDLRLPPPVTLTKGEKRAAIARLQRWLEYVSR